MANRSDIQQFVIPANLQRVLSKIADTEERSMSATVRVMIVRRAKELGISIEDEQPETELANAA